MKLNTGHYQTTFLSQCIVFLLIFLDNIAINHNDNLWLDVIIISITPGDKR